MDLLTKLVWLPLSKTKRVSLLSPVGPTTRTLAVCKYVKLEGATFILQTVVGAVSVDLVGVPASLHMERWCAPLHFVRESLSRLLQALALWPRFKQRKQRWADLSFSLRSVTDVTFLHSWAQWPFASQNTQNGSSLCLSFHPDLGC